MSRSLVRFQSVTKSLIDTKEDKTIFYGGILGTFDSLGNEIIDVPGRSSFVFVRLNGSLGEVIEAFNITVRASSEDFGLKVKVAKKPGEFFYEVVGLDLAQYQDWGEGGANPFLPKHAFTHSFGVGNGVGTDPVFIYKRQLLQPMGFRPVHTGTAFYGYVEPDFYIWDNEIQYFEGAFTANFSGLKPTNSQSRYVTIYLDGDTNGLAYKTGALFTPPSTVAALIANIPEVSIFEGISLAGVYLTSGTTSVNWDNSFDLRNFLGGGIIGTGSAGGGTTITGVAAGAVLFGSPTGTITWDQHKFFFDNTNDKLLIGTSSPPFSTNSRIILTQTGTFAGITAVGYGADGGSFFGRAVAGGTGTPSATLGNKRLLNFEGSGFDTGSFTSFRARLAALSLYNWNAEDNPAFWEMWATPTGSVDAEVVHRWYGGYEDAYKPFHLETLRIGTGSIYTQFTKDAGQGAVINYVLPSAQGGPLTFLRNDGAGALSWVTITGAGGGGSSTGYPTGIPDGVVLFGYTGTISHSLNRFMWDRDVYYLGINITGQVSPLHVFTTGVTRSSYQGAIFEKQSNDANGTSIGLFKSRGGLDTNKPLNFDEFGRIVFGAKYTGTFMESARIVARTSELWSFDDFDFGGLLEFWATENGQINPSLIERIYGLKHEVYVPFIVGDGLRFGTGSTYVEFDAVAPASNITYMFPSVQGAANTYLKNDGVGTLSWGSIAAGGFPTGIPASAVLFGEGGTIAWDTAKFMWNNTTDHLALGTNAEVVVTNAPRLTLVQTGISAGIEAYGFGSNDTLLNKIGGRFYGAGSRGTLASPAVPNENDPLVSLEAGGYNSSFFTAYKARIAAYASKQWGVSANSTLWQIEATITGSSTPGVIGRLYGGLNEWYKPTYLADFLQFGTGSGYTRFQNTSATGITYTLPTVQGGVYTFLHNNGSGALSWQNAPRLLDVSYTETAWGPSSVAETTLVTYSLPGNTLGTNRGLRITVWLSHLNNSGSTNTLTIRLKYGATTVLTFSTAPASNANRRLYEIKIGLKADASATAQETWGTCFMLTEDGTATSFTADRATSTEDSTGDLDIVLTAQNSVNHANTSGYVLSWSVELLPTV